MRCDDEHITGVALRFEATTTEIDTLVSSGPNVAFHARQTGFYLGGFTEFGEARRPAVLHANGLVYVADGKVASGRVIRDRLGLRAALQGA